MKLTFINAGVLIAVARGSGDIALKAMAVLDDPERAFASSPFVRLEVLPKSKFHRRAAETAFYEAFFETVEHWARPDDSLVEHAFDAAVAFGLSSIDALHVAAAAALGADELVTTERPGKPLHRVTSVAVKTIHP